MRNLILTKKNDVHLVIDADEDVRRDLGEHFTFSVPGFKFMPAYRSRHWDGKIRLFSYTNGQIYTGLYPYILNWCKENDVEVVDRTDIKDANVDDKLVDSFINKLKIPFEVRDYQKSAFIYSMVKSRCLMLSPTASGKSLIIYLMVRFNLIRLKEEKNDKILIVVPTTSLVEQLYKDFKDYGYNSQRNVHRIYQGHEKETDKRIVISTWQSIYKMPKKFFEQFGMVVGDEAHLFKAVSLTKIMSRLENCKYRIGLTGTLDDSKTHKLVLEGLFGAVNKIVSTTELQEKEHLAKLKINCLVLKHEKMSIDFLRGKTYQEEMDFLVSNTKRNKYIRNLCLGLKGIHFACFNM